MNPAEILLTASDVLLSVWDLVPKQTTGDSDYDTTCDTKRITLNTTTTSIDCLVTDAGYEAIDGFRIDHISGGAVVVEDIDWKKSPFREGVSSTGEVIWQTPNTNGNQWPATPLKKIRFSLAPNNFNESVVDFTRYGSIKPRA